MKKIFNEGNQIHNFISSSGSGTLINYGSGTGTRHKIMYLISFIKNFFQKHFSINRLRFMNFLPCKRPYQVKSQENFKFFFLFAFYGLHMEL